MILSGKGTLVHENGGFPTRGPKRNEAHLTSAEREEISRGMSCGASLRQIRIMKPKLGAFARASAL
jgi:hypothetical protein